MNVPSSASARKGRRWLPWVGVLGLAALLAWGFRPKAAPVETARVVSGPLRATVSEEGKTRIKQRYVVSAPVSGQLRRVPVKPGADIAAGEVVAVIEPLAATPLDPRTRALAEARRDAAREAVARTREALALAGTDLQRIRRMFEAGTISPQGRDAAEMRVNAAALENSNALGALRAAEAELAGPDATGAQPAVELRAPVAGRILQVFQESARPVSAGTPVLEIGDPTQLEVVIELLSRDGAALAPGAPVEFEQWGGPAPLQGRVRLVEPAAFTKYSALGVEEQRVNVVADITTPLAERANLGDNYRVEARVVVWSAEKVLKVPVSALFRQGDRWAAYVARGGRAVQMPVETGHSSGTEVEVLSGLAEGDEVILYPGDRITDGQRVQPMQVNG